MALWHLESVNGDLPKFRKPYPRVNWVEDMRWNKRPLTWMREAYKAFDIFSKADSERTDADWEYYRWMLENTEQ